MRGWGSGVRGFRVQGLNTYPEGFRVEGLAAYSSSDSLPDALCNGSYRDMGGI